MRIETLRLLHLGGPLSYSEIMQRLGLDTEKQTGRFAYHLRSLQNAQLVEADKKTRKYKLTDIGMKLIEFAHELDEYALKKAGKLLVRTSRLAIEEFDRGKIVGSLIDEAQMTPDLAEQVTREVEDRLLRLDVKYLTAPLIREIVNAVLIERGLEEYRHRMTRLGLPVYDVTRMIRAKSIAGLDGESIRREAADSVIREYVLLNVLPRGVADAHLSGRIHIENLGTFILKPDYAYIHIPQLIEDNKTRVAQELAVLPTTSSRIFRSILERILKALFAFRQEVNTGLCLDMFNVWLAPYAHGMPTENLEEALKGFVSSLAEFPTTFNPSNGVAIGLELGIPELTVKIKVGRGKESYEAYEEDARRLSTALLTAMISGLGDIPVFNTIPVIKVRSNKVDPSWEEQYQLAHKLASERGTTLFANLSDVKENQAFTIDGASFTHAEGFGHPYIGGVVVNLPRVAFMANGDDDVFETELETSVNLALDALRVRYRSIYERIRENLLPYLFGGNGEAPCRFENTVTALGFVGLDEATTLQTGKHIHEERTSLSFAKRCLERMVRLLHDVSLQTGEQVFLTQITSTETPERLALLDSEEYGQGAASVKGGEKVPYYTSSTVLSLETQVPLEDRLRIEADLGLENRGGRLALIEVEEDVSGDVMMDTTRKILNRYRVGLHAYSKYITRCPRCRVNTPDLMERCPNCGNTLSLVAFGRASTRYLPFGYWPRSRQRNAKTRTRYSSKELSQL